MIQKNSKEKLDVEAVRNLVNMGYTDAQIGRKLNAYPFTIKKFRSINKIERFNSHGLIFQDEMIPLTPMAQLAPRVQAYLRSKGR